MSPPPTYSLPGCRCCHLATLHLGRKPATRTGSEITGRVTECTEDERRGNCSDDSLSFPTGTHCTMDVGLSRRIQTHCKASPNLSIAIACYGRRQSWLPYMMCFYISGHTASSNNIVTKTIETTYKRDLRKPERMIYVYIDTQSDHFLSNAHSPTYNGTHILERLDVV